MTNKKLKTLKEISDFDYYYTVPDAPEVLIEDIRSVAREWIKHLKETDYSYEDLGNVMLREWIEHFFLEPKQDYKWDSD